MIIVTDPSRPLPRAGKGTVVRPQALKAYQDDIEKLYVYSVLWSNYLIDLIISI